MQAKDLERARTLAIEARNVDEDALEARLLLAEILAADRRYDEAEAEYEKALAAYPANAKVKQDVAFFHKNAGYGRLLSGDRARAIVHFRRAIAILPDEPELDVLHEIIRNP